MKIKEIQNEIVEEFSFFDDWEQRYEYLIELGKSLNNLPEEAKNNDGFDFLCLPPEIRLMIYCRMGILAKLVFFENSIREGQKTILKNLILSKLKLIKKLQKKSNSSRPRT